MELAKEYKEYKDVYCEKNLEKLWYIKNYTYFQLMPINDIMSDLLIVQGECAMRA